MEATACLLESCADMVLRCSDGTRIPCVRFHCLTTCNVIRNLVEDVTLQKDERGRAVVPFPNVDSADLAAAIDVIHGVRPAEQLGADDVARALRGVRALGHDALTPRLLVHYWEALQAAGTCGLEALHPYASDLVRAHGIRLDVLRRLVVLCPAWPDFSARVLPELDVTPDLARWLLLHLTKFFPAGPLFTRVLELLTPLPSLTLADALSLFSEAANAPAYHPAEAMDAAGALAGLVAARRWDATTAAFLEGLRIATQVYDVAPHLASTLHGSLVLLERTPVASLLLEVMPEARRRPRVTRKMAPWLWLWADWGTGEVDARVTLSKLDDAGRRASACQVRLTAYARGGDSAEVWYAAPIMPMAHALAEFVVRQHGRLALGCEESFRGLVRGGALTRLRVDLFYGPRSVLDRPM